LIITLSTPNPPVGDARNPWKEWSTLGNAAFAPAATKKSNPFSTSLFFQRLSFLATKSWNWLTIGLPKYQLLPL